MNNNFLDILDFIEENDVRFIRLQFCDLFGQNRNISVSYSEFERAINEGIMFKSSSVPGYEGCGDTELILYPELDTLKTLPWRPQNGSVARVLCRVCHTDGKNFKGDSRQVLLNIVNYAKEEGIDFEIGAKIEFYLFELDDEGKPTTKTVDEAGFFDLAPLDKGENTRREIILTLEEMGFSIISSHHEVGSGQHEIDFRMSDPVTCADNIQTFKTVVKTIAERNGMHASFMPKPLNNEPGSGMHIVITAYKDGKNLFTNDLGDPSEKAIYFAGGIYKEFESIFAFANPIVNSYKRLVGRFGSPEEMIWQPDLEDALIRIPKKPNDVVRLIIRNPDSAANPYILFALLLGSGINGIINKTDPKEYSVKLPSTLLDALKAVRKSEFIDLIIDKSIKDIYLKKKTEEWNDYINTVHDWELNKYFKLI